MTPKQATALLPAVAGVVAALLGIPTIAAAMFVAAPLGLAALIVGVAALPPLIRSANPSQRPIVRAAWESSAWLAIAAAAALPTLNAPGMPADLVLIVICGLLAMAVHVIGDRLLTVPIKPRNRPVK